MSWESYHRRDNVLRTVIATANMHLDGQLPWADVDGTAETFGAPDVLLTALQMRWYTRLVGTIEASLADEPDDLEGAVVAAWLQTAAVLPGVRLVLDEHADHKALASAFRREHSMLAVQAGEGTLGDPRDIAVGRRIAERAAAEWTVAERSVGGHQPREHTPMRERVTALFHRRAA